QVRTEVSTSNRQAHPVGSTLPVQYDPERPTRARALVDHPDPYESVYMVGVGIVGTAAIVIPLLLVARRRRRRCLALLGGAPNRRVRVQPWRRFNGNTEIIQLSLYGPDGGPALLTFPIRREDLAAVAEGHLFDLYGDRPPPR